MANFVEYEIPDLIEIRDKKESVKSSVIKRWRVHYVTEEEQKAIKEKELEEAKAEAELDEALAMADQEAEDLRRAQEIFERLEREAAEDAAKKLEEQKLAYAIANGELPPEMYNPTTHSYSGVYGTRPMDDQTKAQLDEIMKESANDVSALFADAEGNVIMNADAEAASEPEIPMEPEFSEDMPGEGMTDEGTAEAEQALFDEGAE